MSASYYLLRLHDPRMNEDALRAVFRKADPLADIVKLRMDHGPVAVKRKWNEEGVGV